MNRRTARQRAIDETWTWEAMRAILADAEPKLTGRTSRINEAMTDRQVWTIMDRAVGNRTGTIDRTSTVQKILQEFVL